MTRQPERESRLALHAGHSPDGPPFRHYRVNYRSRCAARERDSLAPMNEHVPTRRKALLGLSAVPLLTSIVEAEAPAESVCFLSTVEMTRLIRIRKLSAREALAAHLNQIERINPKVNAIVTLVPEMAMDAAARADEMQARKEKLGLLHGLPVAHKDLREKLGCSAEALAAHRLHCVFIDFGGPQGHGESLPVAAQSRVRRKRLPRVVSLYLACGGAADPLRQFLFRSLAHQSSELPNSFSSLRTVISPTPGI